MPTPREDFDDISLCEKGTDVHDKEDVSAGSCDIQAPAGSLQVHEVELHLETDKEVAIARTDSQT